MCVFSFMRDQQLKALDNFDVLTSHWQQVVSAVMSGRADVVKSFVATGEHHPQSSVALEELRAIIPPQRFVCSADVRPHQQGIVVHAHSFLMWQLFL
jgi:hypothetical protein